MATLNGIVVLLRHGDRQGYYQRPTTYTAKQTNLTVLGYQQEYASGTQVRSLYLDPATSTSVISGMNATKAEASQMNVLSDGGSEGIVILDSAQAWLQGLFPPFNDTLLLGNGSTVSWDRTQLISVQDIDPEEEVWMQGYTECDAWTDYLSNDLYTSADFVAQQSGYNAFFNSISSIIGSNRPGGLTNAYNVYDYLNVNTNHNTTIYAEANQYVPEARYWSDYLSAGTFGDSEDMGGIANIAGQSILPPLLAGIDNAANTTSGIKLTALAISYKPFLSLFNMMNLPAPLSTSLVDYASAAIWEVWSNDSLVLKFRNGSSGDFVTYDMFGSDSMDVTTFTNKMQPYSLDTLAKWCDKCSTREARGCGVLAQLNGTGGTDIYAPATSTTGRHHVSPVVAGVIGALVSLAVAAALLAMWLFFGGLVKKQRKTGANKTSDNKVAPTAAAAGGSGYELGSRPGSRDGSLGSSTENTPSERGGDVKTHE